MMNVKSLSFGFKTVILSACVVMFLQACGGGGSSSGNSGSGSSGGQTGSIGCQTGIDNTDKEMLQRTAQMYAQFETNYEKIWRSSYRLDKTPIMYVRRANNRDQCAYLINHPKANQMAGAELVNLPEGVNLPLTYRTSTIPEANKIGKIENFDFNFDLQGTPTFIMKYVAIGSSPEEGSAPNSHDWTLFVAHEGMHNFQNPTTWQTLPGEQDIAGYPLVAEHIGLIILEDKLITQALSILNNNGDNASLDVVLRQMIAVRKTRMNGWSEVALLDLPQEQVEGTARYVEHRLGSLLGFDRINLNSFQLEPVPEAKIRASMAFGRFYGTGAALGYILDKKGISWHQLMEQGKAQFQLLEAEYPMDSVTIAAELAQAKSAHDFEAIMIIAQKAAETAASEPTDIFGG